MDKYEYNLKLEEIDKLVDQGDYEQAAALADTIDWRRVRNVRTLCLISEIYEAAGMLDKSKDMLVRAYRKSPVGRTVLYRLVEVTTALGQYDEALEYYSEYVQVAPHDNNRYILKYMIYKGRGSSPEELIAILEEYLGQEYTERWAYELALNYQQAGQMQKCLATCDDLVLWFHSGKYVKKALDLKKKYAELTPKQQEIYESCLQEEEQEGYDEEAGESDIEEGADGDVIAENIIAETEKEIAGAVSARKAEKDTAEEPVDELLQELGESPEGKSIQPGSEEEKETAEAAKEPAEAGVEEEKETAEAAAEPAEAGAEEEKETAEAAAEPAEAAAEEEKKTAEAAAEPAEAGAEEEKETAEAASEGPEARAEEHAEAAPAEEPAKAAARRMKEEPGEVPEDEYAGEYEEGYEEESEAEEYAEDADSDQNDLQVELAKSVRKVISGVGHKPELNEDDVPAAVEDRLRSIQETQTYQEPEPKAAQLSIDDILLAMGDKGKEAVKAAGAAAAVGAAGAAAAAGKKAAGEKKAEAEAPKEAEVTAAAPAGTEEPVTAAAPAEAKEPSTAAAPAEAEEKAIAAAPAEAEEKAAATEERQSRTAAEAMTEDLTQEELEALKYSDDPGKFIKNHTSLPVYSSDEDLDRTRVIVNTKEELEEAARKEQLEAETIRIPTDEVARAYGGKAEEEEAPEETASAGEAPEIEEVDLNWKEQEAEEMAAEAAAAKGKEAPAKEKKSAKEEEPAKEEESAEDESAGEEEPDEEGEYFDDILTLDPAQRGLFPGFTEVDGLEDQIANAILQAMSKGDDRTSRSGNILIFGAHGSGKTTLATGIARAIAQEKGSKVAKMAKIYAADLNRKDIASTIAKIAGGTLIIEEAGDLEDKTVEQLTTAMEFRTDGLIVILEDEQRYVHELLMNHPRFTMKFTAQIYLPDYTLEELLVFGQLHANEQGFRISDEAAEAIGRKVDEAEKTDTPITVGSMIEMVDEAIRRSNKFMRRMSMGKKRYDEDNYILLFEKDFK